MRLVAERGQEFGVTTLCAAVGLPRASFYRRRQPPLVPAQARSRRRMGSAIEPRRSWRRTSRETRRGVPHAASSSSRREPGDAGPQGREDLRHR